MLQRPDRFRSLRRPTSTSVRVAGALAVLLLLGGCAENRIRDDSRKALAVGQYREAVNTLENGLREYPESTVLRTTLLQMRY